MEYIHVPNYDELSVKRLWKDLSEDPTFAIYFQDEFPQNRLPSRSYFFDILNTIFPDYLQKIMHHASSQRNAADGAGNQKTSIKATDEWYEELQKMPFLSSKYHQHLSTNLYISIAKRGKTLHLLKASSKKIKSQKRRKVIPLLGSIKDYQVLQQSQSQSQQQEASQSQEIVPGDDQSEHGSNQRFNF